jgi:hypothetical protein
MPGRRMGNGRIYPRILDLGTSLEWAISFMRRLLYPRGKCPRYPGGWVGPGTGLDMKKRKILPLPRREHWPLGRPARSQSLYRLRYPGSLYVLMGFRICTLHLLLLWRTFSIYGETKMHTKIVFRKHHHLRTQGVFQWMTLKRASDNYII